MDVVAMYDYYFLTDNHRKIDDRCEFGICENNIVYRRMRCAVDECKRTAELGHHFEKKQMQDKRAEESANGLADVLEYMLYNVSGETGLPAHYSCCMYVYNRMPTNEDEATEETAASYVESGHVCNAIPIMIGSLLERKIVQRLAEMIGVEMSDLYDADYLHKVYAGAFLVNGTFYYSVFRESNNNKICHNSKSKSRGNETVAYFYDKTCNRGVKVFTDVTGRLRINDRDGVEVENVTPDVMQQLYEECVPNSQHYTTDMRLIRQFFAAVKKLGTDGIDDFKNKIYTNYSVGLNTFLNKLPTSAMRNPMWNASLMVGKINFGISQRLSYPKSKSETKKLNEQKVKMCTGGMSTGYLVETQRRRNTRKPNNTNTQSTGVSRLREEKSITVRTGLGQKRKRVLTKIDRTKETTDSKRVKRDISAALVAEFIKPAACGVVLNRMTATAAPRHTVLGSKDIKTSGLMEKMEIGERNGPSTFNQVSVSYLPLIRVLSNTIQKLQVEHVHAESSKTVPRDAYGFVCMKYVGNISTAGKNMLFTDRVQVSYGHVHTIVDAIERGIEGRAQRPNTKPSPLVLFDDGTMTAAATDICQCMYVVINNAVTMWRVPRVRLVEFLVFLKTECHRFTWIKLVGRYLCVYYYEGVPLLRFERGELMFRILEGYMVDGGSISSDVNCLYFSRDELDMLASMESSSCDGTRWKRNEPLHSNNNDSTDAINTTNRLINRWLMRCRDDGGYESVDNSSLLAKHLDQYTDYTAPAKRSVSVNARKSACTNVYYQRAAELIRGFNIFVDPDAYERTTARWVEKEYGLPEWVTLRDFARTRAELDNCPQPQRGGDSTTDDHSVTNFYMFRTVFADVAGYNVEDANVLDASVDLNLAFSYSFSLTFVDRTKAGLDIVVPLAKNASSVCCWDADGNPTTVMFMVCTIRKKHKYERGADTLDGGREKEEDEDEEDVTNMLRASLDVRIVEGDGGEPSGRRQQRTAAEHDSLAFPPFRKLSVVRSEDGNYHVYFMRNDAMLLRKLRRMRGDVSSERPNASNAVRLANDDYVFVCKPEVNPYDALDYIRTRVTTFEMNAGERVVTIDTRVRGRSDKFDGVKIVNSFGQKGLALIKDLRPYFGQCPATTCNVPVQLVMNNCSFVSRQTVGQYLQIRKNMFAVANSAVDEPTSVGYTAVFLTETEPVTKSCLVRFDEMMRSVIITLGLATFQNLKSSLDNEYNPSGLLYPPQTRQILGLYRCFGVAYNFAGDSTVPFASREDVKRLLDIYDAYSRIPKPMKAITKNTNNCCKGLLDVLDAMSDENKTRRLIDIGVLTEERNGFTKGDGAEGCKVQKTLVLRLQGQWISRGFLDNGASPHTGSTGRNGRPRGNPDFLLRTYDSTKDEYETIQVYGDPSFIVDALDNKYTSIDCLADCNTDTTDDERVVFM